MAEQAVAACAAGLCLAMRQTNAVWIAFCVGCDILHELDGAGALPSGLPLDASLFGLRAVDRLALASRVHPCMRVKGW